MLRILIPTDFSSNAVHASDHAVRLFGPSSTYVLFHTHFDPSLSGPYPSLYGPEIMKAAEAAMARAVSEFKARTGVEKVMPEIQYGPFSPLVAEYVKEQNMDAIVMGKRGGTGSALFGSNTTDVIRSSRVPVIAVPEMSVAKKPERILLADDHDEVLPQSLELLRTIARQHGSEVLVAHLRTDEGDTGPAHWSNAIYEQALRDVPHTFIEAKGSDIVDAMERTAHHRKADMIAILHRHVGFFGRLFHPSVSKDLALTTDVPLLVLQQEA